MVILYCKSKFLLKCCLSELNKLFQFQYIILPTFKILFDDEDILHFSSVYVRGITKSPMLHKEEARDGASSSTAMDDVESSRESPSPIEETPAPSAAPAESEPTPGECTISTVKQEKPAPTDEPPYFQEQW